MTDNLRDIVLILSVQRLYVHVASNNYSAYINSCHVMCTYPNKYAGVPQ